MLNAALLKKIWLKKGESPILVIRCSLINWFWPFVFSAVLSLIAFFLMYFLWQYDQWGLIAFFLLLLAAIFLLCRSLFEYYFTCWVLTNLRLVDFYQRGFFRRETSEVIYNRMEDIHAEKTGIFNLGDIYVSLADSRVKLALKKVRGYERAVSEIILQQENYQRNFFNKK